MMFRRMRRMRARWSAWKVIDDSIGGPARGGDVQSTRFGESAAQELDRFLRQQASRERAEGTGRLRWRVLSAVSARAPDRPATVTPRPAWARWAQACAAVCVLGMATGAWYLVGGQGTSAPVPIASHVEPAPEFQELLTTTSRQVARWKETARTAAVRLGAPMETEAARLMQDAKDTWSFFRARAESLPIVPRRAVYAPEG